MCVRVPLTLQSGPIKDALHTVDHPNTTIENVFGLFDNEKYGPAPFDGEGVLRDKGVCVCRLCRLCRLHAHTSASRLTHSDACRLTLSQVEQSSGWLCL